MTEVTGNLRKMKSELSTQSSDDVQYWLPVGDRNIYLNPFIGQKIKLAYEGKIHCIHCNRKTSKSFNQGYCYPCFKKLAQCDMCIMKPEQCHHHEGTCREPDWGDENCMIDHIVYLANSSGLKVGITRHTQVPTRWIDQGAIQALPLFSVRSRYISGLVEVAIANHVADKTNWRTMLKGQVEEIDLPAARDKLLTSSESELAEVVKKFQDLQLSPLDEKVVQIKYPVTVYPTKISSFNLDKNPEVNDVLKGIKGQYLIFENGVINMRKYSGYELTFTGEG